MHCSMFSSIPSSTPFISIAPLAPIVTIKNVSKHCKWPLLGRGWKSDWLRTQVLSQSEGLLKYMGSLREIHLSEFLFFVFIFKDLLQEGEREGGVGIVWK